MKENEELYKFFIEDDMNFDDYLKKMLKDGEWAGQLEVKAIGELFEVNIYVHSS